jgi:hypothetical protein
MKQKLNILPSDISFRDGNLISSSLEFESFLDGIISVLNGENFVFFKIIIILFYLVLFLLLLVHHLLDFLLELPALMDYQYDYLVYIKILNNLN